MRFLQMTCGFFIKELHLCGTPFFDGLASTHVSPLVAKQTPGRGRS
jgi:hypothetical protein